MSIKIIFRSILHLFIVCLVACTTRTNCKYGYEDSGKEYCVNGVLDRNKENSLFEFYDKNGDQTFSEVGFFQDGFRNDKWRYRSGDSLQTIEWGYYKDKYLDFETNTISVSDSIKYGPFFSKIKYTTAKGIIIFAVSVNGPMKDSLPEKNYAAFEKMELEKFNTKVFKVKSNIISDSMHSIYLFDFYIKPLTSDSSKTVIIKSMFCKFDENKFVEFSVRFDQQNEFLGQIFFDAVLTNSYFNKKRLFFPFKNIGIER